MTNYLDISGLKKCSIALEKAILYAQKVEMKPEDKREEYEWEIVRNGVIQHFETAYELCWKMMKRYISMSNWSEVPILTRKDLFRVCRECRLISNSKRWVDYHNARNMTSHTYDETIANEVYSVVVVFYKDMKTLIKKLEQRI